MADPICRWRNPTLETVVEFVKLLPKQELSKTRAREIINQNNPFNAEFFKTPYQLACQLGLYYETNERYFPKFTFVPTKEMVNLYLQNWIIHYCVPNPYTRGFDDLEPFSIHSKICRFLQQNATPLNWKEIRDEIFGNEIGNIDILVNSINSYSPILTITAGIVQLKKNKSYEELANYINVDISTSRSNKEYFFDLFSIPNGIENIVQTLQNQELIQDINQQEIELINQVQNLPILTQTEKNQIVAARIGQGYFRRNLILECGFCPITQVDETTLLIASHIKPWKFSDNIERINPKNGILLTPTYDKLFDKGYISFTDDKRLLVSNILSDENKYKLNVVHDTVYPLLPTNGREGFLNFHRNHIYLG